MTKDYFENLHSTGKVSADVTALLTAEGKPDTLAHIRAVVARARLLAGRFCPDMKGDMKRAAAAAWCHDMAAVVPRSEILPVAEAWGVPLSDADRAVSQVVHGPLAAEVARLRLGIADEDILNAIRYHTTLRAGASVLEKVVFVADKVALDPTADSREFLPALHEALSRSLDAAVLVYLDWAVKHGPVLGWTLHDNLLAAHAELRAGV